LNIVGFRLQPDLQSMFSWTCSTYAERRVLFKSSP